MEAYKWGEVASRGSTFEPASTFGVGDKISLKLGGKPVVVQCLEIHESSAVISVEGISGTREIKI